MTEVEKIEQSIEKLSRAELARFRAWYIEFESRVWDRQIEADVQSGKLDTLISESLSEYKAGKSKEL